MSTGQAKPCQLARFRTDNSCAYWDGSDPNVPPLSNPRLGEVAVFDHTLSNEQIQAYFESTAHAYFESTAPRYGFSPDHTRLIVNYSEGLEFVEIKTNKLRIRNFRW